MGFIPQGRILRIRIIEKQGIIEAKATLWRPGKKSPHHNLSTDISSQGGPCGAHEEIDVFDDVDEGFVAPVLDVASSVGHGSCSLGCYS